MTKKLNETQKIIRKVISFYRKHGPDSWYRGGTFFKGQETGNPHDADLNCGCVMGISALIINPKYPQDVLEGKDAEGIRKYRNVKHAIEHIMPEEYSKRFDPVYKWNDHAPMSFNSFLANLELAAKHAPAP